MEFKLLNQLKLIKKDQNNIEKSEHFSVTNISGQLGIVVGMRCGTLLGRRCLQGMAWLSPVKHPHRLNVFVMTSY